MLVINIKLKYLKKKTIEQLQIKFLHLHFVVHFNIKNNRVKWIVMNVKFALLCFSWSETTS